MEFNKSQLDTSFQVGFYLRLCSPGPVQQACGLLHDTSTSCGIVNPVTRVNFNFGRARCLAVIACPLSKSHNWPQISHGT
ncbi:hypothetical protein PAXRUDRAFT_827397 [Paxillus rubicundulus Ve08.2h10]|uniref:Uncharacterized protein n=1 Tax=Paxillus rubicundulus Ve08.2h10 TaxID=930991 RepID=A0A0D0DCT2_9AGAM|nr:hypothetical protein PAXRUDRAFT_827397 [Paxillus rubicundulus Ve08.2h10]